MVDEARNPYNPSMDEILIEGRVYVSSKQAAKITGYAKDYVGQLCREGRVDARLVGRNWYVLETSIREHRFGRGSEAGDASETVAPEPADSVVDRASTWQAPQYEAEVPAFVPYLAPKTEFAAPSPAIADMQSAWKEWFDEKKPVQEAVVIEATVYEEEYVAETAPEEPAFVPEEREEEEPVEITRAAPEPVYEAPEPEEESEVELHRSYASRYTGERIPSSSASVIDLSRQQQTAKRGHGRPERPARAERASSSIATRAILMVIAIAAGLIAIVGTGNADTLLAGTSYDFGVQKSIINYLGGTSSYESSL